MSPAKKPRRGSAPSHFVSSFVAGALCAASFAGAAGCVKWVEVGSVGPKVPRPAPPEAIPGPFVQAGTAFSARMDQPMDTFYTPRGTPFTATIVNPLHASDGREVVAYGAKLHGTLESVGHADRPHVRVRIEAIDTVDGTVAVEAALRSAQHVEWAGPARLVPETTYWTGEPRDDMYQFYDPLWDARPGVMSGAPVYGDLVVRPREVRIPQGALIEIVLVRPLVVAAAPEPPAPPPPGSPSPGGPPPPAGLPPPP